MGVIMYDEDDVFMGYGPFGKSKASMRARKWAGRLVCMMGIIVGAWAFILALRNCWVTFLKVVLRWISFAPTI